ncbi:MAG: hypothetical protein HWD59_14225 [Coxiellaceae bacterium]|nr:MAG: hypothetical protein HWD59_14225 [Coxiellaceae bacterium]
MPGENLTRNDLLSRMYFSDTVVMLPDGSLKAIDSVVGLNRFQTVYQFFRKSDLKQITTKTLHSNLLASRYRLNETIVYLISQFIGYLQFYDKDIFETERENKETIQVKYQESIKEYLQEIVGLPETSAEFQEYYQAFLTGRPDYLKLNQLLTKNLSTLYQQRLEARIKNLNGMLKEVKTIASQLASTTTIQQNLMPQLDRLVESQWTKPVVKACIADPKLKIFLLSNFPSLNKPFGNGIGTVVNIFMGQAELDGSADTDSHAIMVYVDDKSSYWPTHATLLGEYLIDLPPEVQALPQLVEYRTHSFHSTIAVLTEELSDYSASKLRQDPQYAAEYGQMLNDFHDILNNFDQTNARRDIQVAMEIIKNEGDVNVLKTKEKKDIWKEIKKFVMGIIKNSHPLPRTRIRMIEDNAIREGQSYTIKNWTEYKATYVIEKILATVNIAGKNWSVALMVAPAMSTDSSEWTDLDIAELCVTLLNIYGQSYGAKKAGYSPEIYVPEMRGALLKIISEYPGFARSVTSKHWSSELGKFYRDFHELVEKAAVYPEENRIKFASMTFAFLPV